MITLTRTQIENLISDMMKGRSMILSFDFDGERYLIDGIPVTLKEER